MGMRLRLKSLEVLLATGIRQQKEPAAATPASVATRLRRFAHSRQGQQLIRQAVAAAEAEDRELRVDDVDNADDVDDLAHNEAARGSYAMALRPPNLNLAQKHLQLAQGLYSKRSEHFQDELAEVQTRLAQIARQMHSDSIRIARQQEILTCSPAACPVAVEQAENLSYARFLTDYAVARWV